MTNTKWNSRKLGLVIATETLASFLLWYDKIGDGVWESVTMATVVAYIMGQAWQKRGGSANDPANP